VDTFSSPNLQPETQHHELYTATFINKTLANGKQLMLLAVYSPDLVITAHGGETQQVI
jgi:hypothetical protein